LDIPIDVEYDFNRNTLLICMRTQIRVVDMTSGRVKQIVKGILQDSDDEITAFKST
jgi:hypothetical protein